MFLPCCILKYNVILTSLDGIMLDVCIINKLLWQNFQLFKLETVKSLIFLSSGNMETKDENIKYFQREWTLNGGSIYSMVRRVNDSL